jgi:hypothetical protein
MVAGSGSDHWRGAPRLLHGLSDRGDLVHYLDANPSIPFKDMQVVLITALTDLYPCPQ